MADLKISQLTSATLPLAGTEVLPIVQSSTTKKVATDDLTVKNIRSNATTGILQVAGPAAASTRTMTVPDANFTVARIDASNSFTSDQTLATGNLIQGTAAKGVNFTANTPAAGMTSQLLNWYEEGTFTPTLLSDGAAVSRTYSQQQGNYTRIGNKVFFEVIIVLSAKGSSTGSTQIGGLPFTSASSNETAFSAVVSNTTYSGQITPYLGNAQSKINVYQSASGSALVFLPDTGLANNSGFRITGQYRV